MAKEVNKVGQVTTEVGLGPNVIKIGVMDHLNITGNESRSNNTNCSMKNSGLKSETPAIGNARIARTTGMCHRCRA